MKLGVNVDHVATLRQARGVLYPDPVVAALLAERAGCDSIVVHLREDRRHIQERDVVLVKEALTVPLNLEMSTYASIVDFALAIKPHQATLVPEKRRELTTEGGLDLIQQKTKVEKVIRKLQAQGIRVSVFIDPAQRQINQAKKIGADSVEINTGRYSESRSPAQRKRELKKIQEAARFAKKLGFFVAAGHGLDYESVRPIVKIRQIEELNIGHSLVSRSVYVGILAAVEEMVELMRR